MGLLLITIKKHIPVFFSFFQTLHGYVFLLVLGAHIHSLQGLVPNDYISIDCRFVRSLVVSACSMFNQRIHFSVRDKEEASRFKAMLKNESKACCNQYCSQLRQLESAFYCMLSTQYLGMY